MLHHDIFKLGLWKVADVSADVDEAPASFRVLYQNCQAGQRAKIRMLNIFALPHDYVEAKQLVGVPAVTLANIGKLNSWNGIGTEAESSETNDDAVFDFPFINHCWNYRKLS